jgi:hypothetical protein
VLDFEKSFVRIFYLNHFWNFGNLKITKRHAGVKKAKRQSFLNAEQLKPKCSVTNKKMTL